MSGRVVKIALLGASGRMGRSILANAREDTAVEIVAAVVSPGSDSRGIDAGTLAGGAPLGVKCTSDLAAALATASVAIDVTQADQVANNAAACAAANVPLLVCTTGLSATTEQSLIAISRKVAVLVAPNTSIGVAVVRSLVRRAAQLLPDSFDIEIVEAHHKHKLDAPSGTAKALGEAAAAGRGVKLADVQVFDRAAQSARRAGEIGMASVRGGDIVGTHTVWFAGQGELVTISHQASDRGIFARGALRAAAWLAGRDPGQYSIDDVIGL